MVQVKVEVPSASRDINAERLSPLGDFCRRHDVLLPEVIWFGAHVLFDALIVVAWVARGLPRAPEFLALNVGTLLVALALRPAMRRAEGGILKVLRWWYPVLYYGVFFFECGSLVPTLHPREFDPELIRLDRWLCGTDPTVWLQRFHHPLLSELLQICYFSYYFLPLIAGAAMLRHRGPPMFLEALTVISLAFYTSYIGYFLCPAVGPRFTIHHDVPLQGLWVFHFIQNSLASAEGRMHDCMPSGHTAVTVLAMIYAWRAHKPTFFGMLPFATGLVISTVYLRYHYVVDLLAAIPFMGLSFALGIPLTRFWDRFRGPRASEEASTGPRLDSPTGQTV